MITTKTALVTGGSRGIGRAVALDLARDHHLLIGGTDAERVGEVISDVQAAGGTAQPFLADLADAEALAAAWQQAGVEQLDVVVHSAGLAWMRPVAEAPLAEWRRMFELNVFAVAELTRLTLPALRAAQGQVVAINSGSGYHSGAGGALYSGSKFALRAFTDALRAEERGTVRVTSVHPGRVDTDMQVALQESKGNTDYDGARYIAPESVAATVRTAVDMPEASMVEELSIRPVNG